MAGQVAVEQDERVKSAIAHWAPRFTTNGIAVADFTRITSGISRWDDWCAAWCAEGERHEQLGREALAAGQSKSGGAHLQRASVYYHFAKFVFVDDYDQMRAAHARAVACFDDSLPYLDPRGERVEIPFEGAALIGVLRRPNLGSAPYPIVVLVPGLDSTKEELRSTEELFLQRGLATFAVDGPGQGEAEYALPIRGDWEVPGRAIIDALGSFADLDIERVGVWGVSLGGYYAPRWASGDERVRACVALAGPFDFGEVLPTTPELTQNAFRVRSFSSNLPEAHEKAKALSLAGRAEQIKCPLLIVFGKQDRLIPYEQAERLAAAAGGPTELLMLEDGNHGCMNVAAFHRFRTADWMAQHLGGNVS